MKTKLLVTLLVVSVGFNLFFAVGYYRADGKPPTFEEKARLYAEKLGLDVQQKEVFEQILSETIRRREQIRRESSSTLEAYLAEVIKDNPDPGIINSWVEGPHVVKHRRLMAEQMREFMEALTPEQRKILVDSIRKKAKPKNPDR